MVPLDRLFVARRNAILPITVHSSVFVSWRLLLLWHPHTIRGSISSRRLLLLALHKPLLPQRLLTRPMADVVVSDSPTLAIVLRDRLVFVRRFRVQGYDVPGVNEARDVAETAQ